MSIFIKMMTLRSYLSGENKARLREKQKQQGYIVQHRASLVAQLVKNLPGMQETQVQSLTQEDPLEKGMATHSSILAWRIPQTEEPGELQSMGSQESVRT